MVHGSHIIWRDIKDISIPNLKNSRVRNIPIKDIKEVQLGRGAINFARFKKPGKESVSFSIVAKLRNLDLEANSEAEMGLFLDNLQIYK